LAKSRRSIARRKSLAKAYAKLDQLTAQYQQNYAVRIAAATATIELALGENDTQRAYAAALEIAVRPGQGFVCLPAATFAIGNAMLRREQFAPAADAFRKALTDARTAPAAQLGLVRPRSD